MTMRVNDARKKAVKLLALLNDWDPAKDEMTVDSLFQLAWKKYWNTPRYQRSRRAHEVALLYTGKIAPAFGSKRLSELTASKIRAWHKEMEETPSHANHALKVLGKMFTFAEEQEIRPQGQNPCVLVQKFTEKKRKRFASEDEIKKIGEILEREKNKRPREVAFIYVLMFSGARPLSIESSTWNMVQRLEIDGKCFGIMTFDGKNTSDSGEQETVVLPPQVMELIELLPKNSDTIFGIEFPRKFWNAVREEAGCVDLWARDFRRTFATLGLSHGVDIGMLALILNHKDIGTTTRYAQTLQSKKLSAVKLIADHMSAVLKKGG